MATAVYDRALRVLQALVHYGRAHPTTHSDELYYELLLNYHLRVKRAEAEGQPIVAYGLMLPNEVLYALDLVPFHLEVASAMVATILRREEEAFALAKSFGLPAELCSAHRAMATIHLYHWVPQPRAVVWGSTLCVSSGKSGELIRRAWGIPGFFLDRPYSVSEGAIHHYAMEIEEMVAFLEETTGNRLNPERLREAIKLSQQTIETQRQINRLRKAVPSPGLNRWVNQFIIINWLYGGYPEALAFSQAVLTEMEEGKGQGHRYPERFRLLSVFPPPLYNWKLADWLQERGACVVADPFSFHWQSWEVAPAQPFLSLARKGYIEPHCYAMNGPVEQAVEVVLREAEGARADGAIYWASAGCRQGCGIIRRIKDALLEKLGLPTLVVDMEVVDPSFVPETELKEKLEGFLEVLEARR